MLWPVEPSEAEIKFAGDTLWLVIGAYDFPTQEGLICDNTLKGALENQSIEKQLEYVHLVGDFAKSSESNDSSIELIATALMEKYPCDWLCCTNGLRCGLPLSPDGLNLRPL
jgi:hypothetical protein